MEATWMSIEFMPLRLDQVSLEELRVVVEAAERAGDDPDDIREDLVEGRAILWRAVGGAEPGFVVTQERQWYGEKELLVRLIAGKDARKYRSYLEDVLEEFAKLRGAKRISAFVTEASHRLVTEPLGYKVVQLIVGKEI